MKNEEIRAAADQILSRCDALNRKSGFKRFLPFHSYRGGKLFEYGVYDYSTKKYVLNYAHSLTVEDDLKELDQFVVFKK